MSFLCRMSAVSLALIVASGWSPASAQRGLAVGRLGVNGLGPRLGENIQMALQFRDQLGLSAEQVAGLEDLVAGIERDVEPLRAEIDLLRAQILSGDQNPIDGLAQLQDLQDRFQASAAPYRAQVTQTLTAEQHVKLQDLMFSTRSVPGWGLTGPGFGVGRAAGLGLGRGAGYWARRGGGLGFGRGAGRGFGRGFRQDAPRRFLGRRFPRAGWRRF